MKSLPSLIFDWLEAHHRGHENAIPRMRLLQELVYLYEPKWVDLWDKGDRRLREIYQRLPVCSCSSGIFVPIRTREVEGFREYLMREHRMTAGAADERVRLIYARWPRLRAVEGNQLELQIP